MSSSYKTAGMPKQRWLQNALRCSLLCLLVLAGLPSSASIEEEDNDALTTAVAATIAVHNVALPLSFSQDPFIGVPAQAVTFGANIGLKYIKAPFLEPGDKTLTPTSSNSSAGDRCDVAFTLPQADWRYANFLGLRESSPVPDDWGLLGKPQIAHANSEVVVSAKNRYISNHDPVDVGLLSKEFVKRGLFGRTDQPVDQQVVLPAGLHTVEWHAATQIDTVNDVIVPAAFLGFNIGKYGAAWADGGIEGARLFAREQTWKAKMIEWAIKGGFIGGDQADLFETDTTVSHVRGQSVTVHDVRPPVLEINQPIITVEAADFGGTLLSRVKEQLRGSVTAYDECGRGHTLANDAPFLLEIGDNEIEWTVSDFGPNLSGEPNRVLRSQIVRVEDTQSPIIVAPPSRVVEIPANDAGVTAGSLQLGVPLVVDLADAFPDINSDGPQFYPINSRANITWSATDDSGNVGTSAQFVTVKAEGTNTTPIADNASATTLTSQPVDIVLRGSDADFLDGQFDPISFNIEARPTNGEFVAPLFPFFIEDYRTNPAGPYGDDFRLSNNQSNWMYDNVCRQSQDPRKDWVYRPYFTQVTDDGIYYILDFGWRCQPSNAQTDQRISKWDRDGNYLGEMDYAGTNDTFTIEGDFIYTLNRNGAGSSTTLRISRCRKDFDVVGRVCDESYKFDFASAPGIVPQQLSYARIDVARNLLYLNDRRRIFVFDISSGESEPPHVGTLANGERVIGSPNNSCNFGSSWTGFTMELDSEGSLYVLDSCTDRVHKFTASNMVDGTLEPGDYVGWMGRCDASTNKACDLDRSASKGYSCTDATCTLVQNFVTSGSETGQFADPEHMAMDPNDVLYVADRGNSRVQRFAPDGSFAGEAVSEGTGVNQGDRPGFVLGNMGNPRAVSVNSTQFFVTDREESFVHVFQTSPFKDITPNSATVSYVSNFDFHSSTDSFTFTATDGLATSLPATATIMVNRNFRAPIAFPTSAGMIEESEAEVVFSGDDPDGILGVDFNGLDQLTYRVIQEPQNGTLSGTGDRRTYTPYTDFSGTDHFFYVANDGVHDSAPARVDLDVAPVDDAPRMTEVRIPPVAGLGFEMPLRGQFVDDGSVSYQTSVNWGDGSAIESRGDYVEENGSARLEGVKIVEPADAGIGVGQLIASHSYASPGAKNIQVCVWDEDGDATCQNGSIDVQAGVYLDLDVTPQTNEVSMSNTVILDVEIINVEPSGVPALAAEGVRFVQDSDSTFEVVGVNGAPPGCAVTNGLIDCAIGNMAPGAQLNFEVTVRYAGARYFSELAAAVFEVTTTSNSFVETSLSQPIVAFMADTTDSDGDGMTDVWEQDFGLNPNSAGDSSSDTDADGLTAFQEFAARTQPNNADSDNDGYSDGVEVAQGSNPILTADTDRDGLLNDVDLDDDGDGMVDAYELNAGLDPLDAMDALADLDGDGVSNLAESRAGSSPNDANDQPAPVSATPTLFSSLLPLNRSGVIDRTVSAFATILNTGNETALNCSLAPSAALDSLFSFQATNPATNAPVGQPNTPVDIEAGGLQTFVFEFTAQAEIDAEVAFLFDCTNTEAAPSYSGINTFRLQASLDATPDLVALAATASSDGIARLANGVGAFSVASVNVGSADWLTVRTRLPAGLNAVASVCQTDPITGSCLNPVTPAAEATLLVNDFATPTFSVFIASGEAIALDPVGRRVFVEFIDSTGKVRGSTSVALETTQ